MGGKPIAVVDELKYLGMCSLFVLQNRLRLTCMKLKTKYIESLNAILGKVGLNCALKVVLSLVI